MPFDTLTTTAVRLELIKQIIPGRVQRIVQSSAHSIGLEIYAGSRTNLLISANPQNPYIALTEEKPRRGTKAPSPLEQLLRKYVRGARLVSIEQPELERILTFHFEGPEGATLLVCEMMGRLSNVILVDSEGLILDSMHRVPASVNRVRTILPRKPYAPPPPQDKLNPLKLVSGELGEALDSSDRDALWQKVVDIIGGLSPLAAREIAFRASGSTTDYTPSPDLYDQITQATASLWEQSLSSDCANIAAQKQYAPYLLTHLGDYEQVGSISEAILLAETARGKSDMYGQARTRVRALLDDQKGKLEGKLASLQDSLVPKEEIERIQQYGNAVFAMAYEIVPGQTELMVKASLFDMDSEETWHIPLDPALSASENAQKLFAKYRKRRDAAFQVPELIEQTREELAFIAQLASDLNLAKDRNQIDQVEQALIENGYLKPDKKRSRPKRSEPHRLEAPDGTIVLMGRNSQENDKVTFHLANSSDIWLHAHGVPGSHVILRSSNALSDDALLFAAELAAFYSSAQDSNRVQVDFCERRYVKHMPGGKPGMVTYTHEQTIVVEPQDHLEKE